MQHLDPDRLVILALGESAADSTESVHLVDCAGCRAEIDALQHVAGLSAQTQDLHELPPPPDRVWQGIMAEVAATRSPPGEPDRHVVPLRAASRARGVRSRGIPRWLPPILAAAAAAVLAVVGTVAVLRWDDDGAETPAVTAQATLAPLAAAPANARGEARVLTGRGLHLHVQDLPEPDGYLEVWLIDPDNPTNMRALGYLSSGTDAVLPIPSDFDLNTLRLVDVSAEPNDGNLAHSGKSLLRGTLSS